MRKSQSLTTVLAAVFLTIISLRSSSAAALDRAALLRPLRGEIILGFNEGYTVVDGSARYHKGTDIAGSAGQRVAAAGTGRVTFCGRVPGAAGGGSSVLAVTVRLADGRLATYLPLATAAVARGDQVAQGDAIGSLAADGDSSSAETHLHFGLREHGTYVDPGELPLPPLPSQQRPQTAPASQEAVAGEHAPTSPANDRAPHTAPSGAHTIPAVRPQTQTGTYPAAVRTDRGIAPARRPASNHVPQSTWAYARRLSVNRPRPWIDPRTLRRWQPSATLQASHPRSPSSIASWMPRTAAHPLALLLTAGALAAVSSVLGALRRAQTTNPLIPQLAQVRRHD